MTDSLPVDRLVVCHGELFDAYGIDPDPEHVDFYRRCWNACDVSSH